MGFFPYDPGHTYYLQTDVLGERNVKKIIAEQSWVSPNAADDDVIMPVETVPALGAVYDVADGLGGVAQALILTVGGIAGDVKAVNIAVVGTDDADQALSENFLLTVNTVGKVVGTSLFKTVTSVTSPAQDGAGVTLKLGTATDDDCVMKEVTIPAAGIAIYIGKIAVQPDEARGINLVLGGVAGDTNAGTTVVTGTDFAGDALSENYTVQEDTNETVVGAKAFKTVTRVFVNPQDGAGVTLKVGTNDKLGLNEKLPIDTVLWATLGGTKEAVSPAVTTSATVLALNTVDLNSALNNTAVKVAYII